MNKQKGTRLPDLSPICSDAEDEYSNNSIINVILEDEEPKEALKETPIEYKKTVFVGPVIKVKEEENEVETKVEKEAKEEAEEVQETEEAEVQEQEEEEAEEEPEEAEEEAEEAEEAQEEKADFDNNTKDFIVLCTHRYLYNQEVPKVTNNKHRQLAMEKIIARHVDSICEAFRYLS